LQARWGEEVPIREMVVTYLQLTFLYLVYIPRPYFFRFYESFNGKLRDELLNGKIFTTLMRPRC
jgi:hypothetical protein